MMKTLRIDRKELRTILSLILVLAMILAPMATPVYALPATYTVSFNMHGIGDQVEPQEEIEEGGHATAPDPAPASDDYTFSGWYTVEDGNWSVWNFDSNTVASDITLHAGWQATITYHAKLDTATGSTPAAVTDKFVGQTFALADGSTLTDADYFLIGWDTNPDATEPTYALGDDYTVTGNADLYGIWEAKKYVTYDINAVTDPDRATTSGAVTDTTAYKKGDHPTAKANGFTYVLDEKNMVFQGWGTSPSQRTNLIAPDVTFAMGSSDATLYAVWSTPCAVTYKPGNVGTTVNAKGTMTDAATVGNTRVIGDVLVLPECTFTAHEDWGNPNIKFIGWQIGDDANHLYDPGYTFTVTGDTVITAVWKPAYTLSYSADSGSGILPLTKNVAVVSEGDTTATVKAPTDLMKDGYFFWKWNDGVNDYFPGDTITLTGDTTLTAEYGKKVTVEFAVNNDVATKANAVFVVDSNASTTVVPETYDAEPSYNGNLDFAGWYQDPAFRNEFVFGTTEVSVPAEENTIKLYGKWTGGFPYFINFVPYTKTSELKPEVTYLFTLVPKERTDAVFELPSGSAVLIYLGNSDPATLYANYGGGGRGYDNHSQQHAPQGYVYASQKGHGFDTCDFGGVYNLVNTNGNWYYNCWAGGAHDVGPFYAYTYDIGYTDDVVIELNPDSTYVYKKDGGAPLYSDFIVKVKKADDEDYTTLSAFELFDFDNTTDNGTIKVKVGEYVKAFSFTGKKNHKNTQQTVVATVSGGQSSSGIGASLSGNNATVDKLTNAQVKAVAGEKGSDVRIDISGLEKNINQITIPAQTVESVANTVNEGTGNKGLTLALPGATVTLDNDAFNAVKEQAQGDLKLVVDQPKQTTLKTEQRSALADKDVKIVVDAYFVSNGKRIGDFKGGKVTVSIPYTPKQGEDTSKLQAYYIEDNGNMTAYPTTWKDGNTYFDVDHFSHFVVLYEGAAEEEVPVDTSAFIDLKAGAWYMDAVKYCLENGYMKGINSTYFGGLLNTTRAEVATIIWRMEGCPAPAAAAKFTDIPQGKWYSDSVAWGTENGVLLGISDTEFAPDATITREQLTAMFYRYSNLKNKAAGNDGTALAKFKDASNVTAYAVDSMKWATSEGLVNGIGGNLLVPRDFTTRFQLATMIWKYRSL